MKTLIPILKTKLFLLGFISACTIVLATTVPQIKNLIAPPKANEEKIVEEKKENASKKKTVKKKTDEREMNASFEATVVSDQPDYAPLSTAIFTGDGFAPNEDVVLKVKNLNQPCNTVSADSSYFPWTVTSDDYGHFETTWTVCNCPGDSLRLRAVGQTSHDTAYAYFTDNPISINITSPTTGSPVTVIAGCDVTINYTYQTTATGSTASATTTIGSTVVTGTQTGLTRGGPFSNSTTLTIPTATAPGNYSVEIVLTHQGNTLSTTQTNAVTVLSAPNAGTDQTVCTSGTSLSGNSIPPGVTAAWSVISGGATIPPGQVNNPSANVNNLGVGANVFQWTFTLGSCVVSDQVTITRVADNTPPTISATGTTTTLGCNPSAPDINAALGAATATDACSTPTVTASDGTATGICPRSQTRTFTARDAAGNTATTSRTVTWSADVTPPVFTELNGNYNDVNLGCNPSSGDITGALNGASASDACSAPTMTFSDGSVVSNGCNRSQTRTFTAKDGCNNTSTISRTALWKEDATPPGFTGNYDNVSLGCNPDASDITGALGAATATDFCTASPTITSSDGSVTSDGCSRSQTRTFTAKDGCNNTSTIARTVTWIHDVTPPTGTVGGTTNTLGCNPTASDINDALGTATATDACGPTTLTQSDGSVQSNGCNRSQSRTFVAIDGCGNGITATRIVTWTVDIIPPVLTGSYTTVPLGCNPAQSDITAALGSATASDGCGPTTIAVADGNVQSNGCNRSQTRTFTARDGCGNTATVARTVTWTFDITAPEFISDFTPVDLGCNPAASDITGALGNASATDACGPLTITISNSSVGSDGCDRTQTRTFTARDGCGNTATASRTVNWIQDIIPPVFTGSYATVPLGCNPSANDIGTALGTATAIDACSAPSITQSDGSVVSNGCNRTQTRIFTAEDGCGNTATVARTVTWTADVAPPVWTFIYGDYNDVDLGCNPLASDITGALNGASASDQCGAPTITFSDGSVQSDECLRSQTRTFTARDGCGNTSTISRTARWIHDVTPPTGTVGGTTNTLGCNPTASDINDALGTATATDACGPTTITQSDGSVQSNGCNRSQTRTFTARDGCGNGITATRLVTWTVDITPPTFTGNYATIPLGCNPGASDITGALGAATATDFCGNPGISSSDGSVVSNGCNRSQTRTFTATDGCTNTATIARTVTWTVDVTPPQFISDFTPVDLDCNPAASDITAALGNASATDACGPLTITISNSSVGSNGCGRTQTRTFTARDGCGNTATASRTVTWIVDVTPPGFTGSYTTVDLACNPSANQIGTALDGATATDACSAPTISQSDGSVVSNGCSRSQTRTFTASDHCGNTSTISRTVTWIVDVTPPTFTGSYSNVPLSCNPKATDITAALDGATASDACGPVTITQSDGSVQSDGCIRSQTRTFTARDGCNNTSTISRTVTWTADTTPPDFTGSYTTVDLDCNPTSSAITTALDGATATDGCGPTTVTFKDGTVISNGCNRSQIRTFTAKDGCNNQRTISRTVTWIADLTAPGFFGTYTTVNLDCNPVASAITAALDGATATDACSAPTITQSDGSVASNGCGRSQTRTFTATDHCGNTSTTSRTVTWIVDVTPPGFTGTYTTVDLDCNPVASAITAALDGATATDGCGPTTITQSDGSVASNGCGRSQTRTFTARDHCGNTSTTSRTVTWIVDVTPPAFTGNYNNVPLGCNAKAPAIETGLDGATATDACSAPTITQSDGSVQSNGCSRSQTRTFTARDHCGNTATISRTVTWTADENPPVFTGVYTNVEIGCNPAASDITAALDGATATDACSTPTVYSFKDGDVSSNGCTRSQTRTFFAKDGCENISTISRTVTWTHDITPPTGVVGGTTLNLGCNPSASDINNALGTATATDACGPVTLTQSDDNVISTGCGRSQKRTFTARDGCGNGITATRTVTWIVDLTPPVLTGSYSTIPLGCNPAQSDITAALGSATATDGCGALTITPGTASVESDGCLRSQKRTFTAQDGCGNTATVSRTVTWTVDLTPPVFCGNYSTVPLGCNPAASDITNALGNATATDGCGPVTITLSNGSVGSNGCNRTQTRTFTARDGCGNTSTASRTVTWIQDLTPPAFTNSYATVPLGCNPSANDIATALGTATATDACGAPTITQSDGSVVSNGCNRTQTRTFTAEDGCGNTATIARTVTWTVDVTPPVFCGNYANVPLGCNPAASDITNALGNATATDGCGPTTIAATDNNVQSNGCSRSQTRTFTARDGCGNTSSTSRTVTWTYDVTPPTGVVGGTNLNLGCNPTASDINSALGTATATDACGPTTLTQSDGNVVSNGCNRSQTRTFTARDACGNGITATRTAVWISDVTPPTITCPAAAPFTRSTNAGVCTYKIVGTEFNATATDACTSSPTMSYCITNPNATTITGTGSLAGKDISFGSNTIKWTATDGCNNSSTCSFTVNVNNIATLATVTVSPATQQYSDKVTFTATVTPFNCTGAGTIGGEVKFKIGTMVIGTAPIASDGTATLTTPLLEDQLYDANLNDPLNATSGPLDPQINPKTVTACFENTDPDYLITNPTTSLTVTCEDADITYNGQTYFTVNPNTLQGTVNLSAYGLDINDVPPQARGDIRNATAKFRDNSASLGVNGPVLGEAAEIPFGLIFPGNYQEGIATTFFNDVLSNSEASGGGKVYQVWTGGGNYYCGGMSQADYTTVTLGMPGQDFVTGGGYTVFTATNPSAGTYAGTVGKRMNVGFVMKMNPSGTNLQGQVNVIFRRVVSGVTRIYQIKSNAINTLVVQNVNDAGAAATGTNVTFRKATITTKANLKDITDPLNPISLGGNLSLTVVAWESTTVNTGALDRITVQLNGSGSLGLLFANSWGGSSATWQTLTGGKIQVRNSSTPPPGQRIITTTTTTQTTEVVKSKPTLSEILPFDVKAFPNPSGDEFNVYLEGANNESVSLTVYDALGRQIKKFEKESGNVPIHFGRDLKGGIYILEVVQGENRKTIKLVKQ